MEDRLYILVTLDKSFHIFLPQLSHLYHSDDKSFYLIGLLRRLNKAFKELREVPDPEVHGNHPINISCHFY